MSDALLGRRRAAFAIVKMIEKIGDADPTTRHMLISIMAVEEQHADDMKDLLN